MNFPVDRAQLIHMVALDVDGVLTDGGIVLDSAGVETKRFHVRDGLGIRLLLDAGLHVGVITTRTSAVVTARARELALSFVHQGVEKKWDCLKTVLQKAHLTPMQCAFMGDDLVDLPVLTQVGLATAPTDADPEVKQRVHWVASHAGGQGAVRELAEGILRAQGRWSAILAKAYRPT